MGRSFMKRQVSSTQYTMPHTVYRSIKWQKLSIAYKLPVTGNNITRAQGLNWGLGVCLGASIGLINVLVLESNASILPIPSTNPCENGNTCMTGKPHQNRRLVRLPIWSCLNDQLMWLHMYICNRWASLLRRSFDSVPSIGVTNVFVYSFASVNRHFYVCSLITNLYSFSVKWKWWTVIMWIFIARSFVVAAMLWLYRVLHGECCKGVGRRQFVAPEKSAAQIPTLTKIDTIFWRVHGWKMGDTGHVVCRKVVQCPRGDARALCHSKVPRGTIVCK